ncbi:type 1 glutamine amidotransferase domain-containing protein [Herbaspirillum chlorophenolicum]|jgi:putative intracellular protease/amidase|uniref:type 1 glutamine amidotransferase domain-containing protein n=1 Tax=Herbaspirillum chlorophenolicum TaxID=211589 RepID=UPI00067D845C|nr:type 1 glutamine amidotransferase domain-containing protein [Herbaspirillum chlorophenolicum]
MNAVSTQRLLMIVTSHATLGEGGRPTGVWFEELATPYYHFIDAGLDVRIASVTGGKVPIDPHSLAEAGKNPASVERFLADAGAMRQISEALPLDGLRADDYAAIFLPGGHGTMWDLPASEKLATLLAQAWSQGKVLAAVCHGPAGLTGVTLADGSALVAGRRVSAFTNSEEEAAGLTEAVPFLLETRLRDLGARYESGADFAPFAVRDGKLVTGQNPASSEAVAQLVLDATRDASPSASA